MHVRPRAARAIRTLLFGQICIAAAVLAPEARAQTRETNAASPAALPEAPAATASPAPVFLNHPILADTAHITFGDTSVTLFGIKGWAGDPVRGLQSFLTDNGDRVTCQPHAASGYTCMLPTGIDLAEAALANGAAEAIADAPAAYQQQEAAAQAGHLGIWADLPPVPVTVEQPIVQTTAEIVGNGQSFPLDGLVGFPAQFYTLQLQSYITAHGNRLSCQQQPNTGRYVCLLPDGTDIAAVALSNGLARATEDAAGQYRVDQAKAVANGSGFWFSPPSAGGLAAIPVITPASECCVNPPGDLGEGLSYAGGVPTAVIDDEPAFFGYAGLLGFGFFDVQRRWHRAPAPYLARLDRLHPDGAGLRSQATPMAARQFTAFRSPGLLGATTAPRVFNGPRAYAGDVPFHAPGVSSPRETLPPDMLDRPFGAQRGTVRPNVLTPLGIGQRPGFPGITPFRPLGTPHFAPRPGFAGVGGFRPAIVAQPHFASPPPIGRR